MFKSIYEFESFFKNNCPLLMKNPIFKEEFRKFFLRYNYAVLKDNSLIISDNDFIYTIDFLSSNRVAVKYTSDVTASFTKIRRMQVNQYIYDGGEDDLVIIYRHDHLSDGVRQIDMLDKCFTNIYDYYMVEVKTFKNSIEEEHISYQVLVNEEANLDEVEISQVDFTSLLNESYKVRNLLLEESPDCSLYYYCGYVKRDVNYPEKCNYYSKYIDRDFEKRCCFVDYNNAIHRLDFSYTSSVNKVLSEDELYKSIINSSQVYNKKMFKRMINCISNDYTRFKLYHALLDKFAGRVSSNLVFDIDYLYEKKYKHCNRNISSNFDVSVAE